MSPSTPKTGIHHSTTDWTDRTDAFNVNQMPCKTLGFSAHELVYGRNLRSELDRLRDEFLGWDAGDKAVKRNVIAFMTEL